MYLKSLEMTGFKSFGKKASLEFNSSISAIVGPNGSGKSNIAEAFRFVLGEQSIKSLRGKRGEDLIFNGGKALPRMNRGSVKVIFDNKKRMLDLDFDEVSIERIVNRDGTNEYKMNGSEVRLKDIVELLSGAHIGSSGHHIISQGEADRILNASLFERRSILEEALGLKNYQYKKEEGVRKLERTELNMKETESLVRELAPHLKFLKKQYEKIEKAGSIRVEFMELAKTYFKIETSYVDKRTEDISNKLQEIKKAINDLSLNKKSLEKDFNVIHEEEKKDSNLFDLESVLRKTTEQKEEKNRELGKIEGEIAYLSRSVKKMEEENEVPDVNITLNDVEHLRMEVFKIETLEEAKKIIDDFISRFSQQNEGDKRVHNELLHLKNELQNLETKRYEYLSLLEELKKKEEAENAHISEWRRNNENKKKNTLETERTLMHLESDLNKKIEEESRIQIENIVFEEEKSILKTDLQEISMLLGRDVLSFGSINNSQEDIFDRAIQHERKRTIERLKIRLEEAGIANATDVIREYKETEDRDTFLKKELADLELSKSSLQEMIKELEEKIDIEFKTGIKKINLEFSELFKIMFGGGNAELEIVKEQVSKRGSGALSDLDLDDNPERAPDPLLDTREGIDIIVELPHKRTKGLVMLSGGERALTSIALLFAMSQVNPPPFIILDETDAALDEANSRKYGDMIERLSSSSELILITHNRETMSRAGIIYGVTMATEGTSKLLSIKFDEAVVVAK